MRKQASRNARRPSKHRYARLACAIERMETRVLMSATVADWTFETSAPTTAGPYSPEVGAAGDAASGSHAGAAVYSTPAGNASTHSYSSNVWAPNDFYQFALISGTSRADITQFAFDQMGSNTGPKDFKVQYSTDGTSYVDLPGGTYSVTNAFVTHTFSLDPTTAAALTNSNSAAFRIVDLDTTPITGTTVASTGTDRVDNVIITGNFTTPGAPSIGAVTVSPTTAAQGVSTTITLSANATETPGSTSINDVKFYREATSGSESPGSDPVIGDPTAPTSGSTYSVTFDSSSLAINSYTFYAVATDTNSPVLTAASPAAATSTNTLSVIAAPVVSFTPTTFGPVNENAGTATITVTLSSNPVSTVTVNYTTSDGTATAGTDYTTTSGTLTFTAGSGGAHTTQTFTVPLTNVKTFAGSRTVNLTLTSTTGGVLSSTASTAVLTITDNAITAPNGTDTPNSTPSLSNELTTTAAASTNSFLAIAPSSVPFAAGPPAVGFGSGTNVGPDMPFLEFSSAQAVFPTTYQVSAVDSIRLSLFNTATTSTFGGHPGAFDVYLLTNDTDAVGAAPTARYMLNGNTAAQGNTGPTVIGSQGTPVLVGTAVFPDNVVGYNDFNFDNLASGVGATIATFLNNKTALRFVLTPSTGSAVSADWEGNSTFSGGAEKPVLTILAEKSAAIVESFKLDAASTVVHNSDGTLTVTVDRSGSDLTDTATGTYTLHDGTAILGSDYAYSSSVHTIPFGSTTATSQQVSFTVQLLTNASSFGDKTFSITLDSVTVTGSGHLASLGTPTTESVSELDSRTTDVYENASAVATVQPTGPRQPSGTTTDANVFWNIENATAGTAGASASYGVADYNTDLPYTLPGPIGTINQIFLYTVDSPASFTAAGLLNVYLVDDTTTSIANDGSSPLKFLNTANGGDDVGGLGPQLNGTGTKHLLGQISFAGATQPTDRFTGFQLTSADSTTLGILANDLTNGLKFRIAVTPADATVSATFTGIVFNQTGLVGTPNPNSNLESPVIGINYSAPGVVVVTTPAWIDQTAGAPTGYTWNAGTKTLDVTTGVHIIGDPGTDEPNITTHAGAVITADVPDAGAAVQAIHIGSLSLTSASMTINSVGANTFTHHDEMILAGTLSITGTSKLDLVNNDAVFQGTSSASILADLKTGRSSGATYWTGTGGIDSSAAHTNFLTTLGTETGTDYNSGGAHTFDGANVGGTDVLVKYTYYGDADLSGKPDGADYTLIDNGFGSHATVWSHGDFNYDGVVDGTDYSLIDNTVNQYAATGASPLAVVAGSAQPTTAPAMMVFSNTPIQSTDDLKDKKSLAEEILD
jgi:hypothetical protein